MTKGLKIVFIVGAFIFSLDIVWNWLISIEIAVLGKTGIIAEDRYVIQAISALVYLILSIFFTEDGKRFARFMEKQKKIPRIIDGFLCFASGVLHFILLTSELFLLVLSEDDKKSIVVKREELISKYREEYRKSKNYPLVVRFIISIIIPALPLAILVPFVPEIAMRYVNIVTLFVAIIGMVFICSNCTDKK